MAKNLRLKARTAHDIDERIERVLRGLGQPEPPLRLEDVRELLKLDREFYGADDPSLIREVVSRIRVATIQVAQRPMLLLDAIKKWSLQALYVPDRKRILLDSSLPEKKHRWSEAHEIVQDFLVEDRPISPVGDHLTGSLAEPKATSLTLPSSCWQVCGL